MRKSIIFSLAALLALASCKNEVYYNANIYTSDTENPEATALVVKDGKILFVGNDADAKSKAGLFATKHDMEGKRILPGICDTHCHYFALSNTFSGTPILHLDDHDSHAQTLEKIKAFADQHSKEELPVITGYGWGWDVKVLASELDNLGIDRPIILFSCDGHTSWVNSATLEQCGIDKNFKDIAPGASYFERDEEGNPTGRVVETAQSYWLAQAIHVSSTEGVYKGMGPASQMFNKMGITTIYDAGAFMVDDETALKAASQRTDNTLRVFASIFYNGLESDDEWIERAKRLRDEYTTDLVRPNTFKAFKDGTMEVATAYMYEPYSEPLGTGYGVCMFPTEQLLSITKRAAAEGFNIHIHAIGDRAVGETLDVMNGLGEISGTKTIAHCQVVANGVLDKFIANKDVFYQTTPVWVIADENFKSVFGDEIYTKYDMPLKSVFDGGVTLTFGSDAPASIPQGGMEPMKNIWAAVNQGVAPTLNPRTDQNLTVAQCVDAYTINAARQFGAEDEIGSITAGKSADFIVLEKDIFNIEPMEIGDVQVEKTYLKGNLVYEKQ